jgi:hypothetical protein
MLTARGPRKAPRRGRSHRRSRRCLAVAVALGCCALALACIPLAFARPDNHSTSPDTPTEQPGEAQGAGVGEHEHQGAEQHRGSEPQTQQSAAQDESPAPQGAADHGHQNIGGSPEAQGSPTGERGNAEAQAPPSAASHERHDARHGESQAKHDESQARHGESQAKHDESQARHGESQARHGESQARHGESQARHGESRATRDDQTQTAHDEPQARQRAEHHERQSAGSTSQSTPSSTATGATSATTTPPAAAPVAGAAAAPVQASPTASSTATTLPVTQGKGGPRPVVFGVSRQAARHTRRVSRRTPRRGRDASRSARLPVASPRMLAPVAADRAARGRGTSTAHPKRAAHSRSRHHRTSPIVTTITRIVGVVPQPVRVLIGVLLVLTLTLGLRSRVTALRARRLERQRVELLEDVGLLQAALLPVLPARLGSVGTSAAYRPADGPGAGGDFYDLFALDDGRLAVIVGDVSGHGRQALPHTALLRFTLRAYLEAGLSPRVAVQTAGTVLERQLGESFATVVAATYHPRERTLVYACAGHPPPLVIGPTSISSIAPITVSSAPPIGVGMRTGTRQTTVSIPGDAVVCFYTDGVTEARVGPELFGAARLERALAELGSQTDASALLDRVAQTTDARPDDMAACLLGVSGLAEVGGSAMPAAPTVLLEEIELDGEALASARSERFLLACGVESREIPELISAARLAAGRAGTVILELRPAAGGPPKVTLRRDNVARLHTAPAQARAVVGASQ